MKEKASHGLEDIFRIAVSDRELCQCSPLCQDPGHLPAGQHQPRYPAAPALPSVRPPTLRPPGPYSQSPGTLRSLSAGYHWRQGPLGPQTHLPAGHHHLQPLSWLPRCPAPSCSRPAPAPGSQGPQPHQLGASSLHTRNGPQ